MSDELFVLCLILFIPFCVIYFLPAIVAGRRRHPNGAAIFLLNLFLGWTILGWVMALVWAAIHIDEQSRRPKLGMRTTIILPAIILVTALAAPCNGQVRRVYRDLPAIPSRPNFDPTGGFIYPTPNYTRMRAKAKRAEEERQAGRRIAAGGNNQNYHQRILELEARVDAMRQEIADLRRELAGLKNLP
jgi:hypothetical protein